MSSTPTSPGDPKRDADTGKTRVNAQWRNTPFGISDGETIHALPPWDTRDYGNRRPDLSHAPLPDGVNGFPLAAEDRRQNRHWTKHGVHCLFTNAVFQTKNIRSRMRNDCDYGAAALTMTADAALGCTTRILKSTNTQSYPSELVSALRDIAGFEIYAFVEYLNQPTFVEHNMSGFTSSKVLDTYLSGTYPLDAAYAACRNGIVSGLY